MGNWYWKCPNCGNVMFVLYILMHYQFCAMTTPPQNQPGRQDDIQAEKDLEESKKLLGKKWWEDE